MSDDLKHLAQRVLDLDAQATEGPWEATTNGYCTTLLPDRDWGPHNHASEIAIAYSNTERIPLCATEDEFDASTQDSDDPKVIGQTITDLRLCAEYRTAAPALARAILAMLDENARLRREVATLSAKPMPCPAWNARGGDTYTCEAGPDGHFGPHRFAYETSEGT